MRLTTAIFATLLSSVYPCISLADAFYHSVDDLIAHNYQRIDNETPSGRKYNEDAVSNTDYSQCYNKLVKQHPKHTLLVMCSDMSSMYDNEDMPTDIYVLEESEQGLRLLLAKRNVGYRFDGVVNLGVGKWAIHAANSAMNQGYGQTHDSLLLFAGDKFISVANWTSWLSNEGALGLDDENIENELSVDTSYQNAEFYPLAIRSRGVLNKHKFDKIYHFQYDTDNGKYNIPESLSGGY